MVVGRQILLRRLSYYTRSTMGYLKEKTVYDMISDTATKPTDQMFEIMKQATRGDDVYHVNTPAFFIKVVELALM
jgi:Beta-eliminating lyase